MQRIRCLLTVFALTTTLAACAPDGASEELLADPLDGEQATALGKADAAESATDYFLLRHDERKCISPRCGGYFIQRLNRARTRCPDGEMREECYVASADWSGLELDDATLVRFVADAAAGRGIVRATVELRDWETFGPFGHLVVTEGWQGATAALPDGSFYRLTDNGVRCITTPCFSIHEARVSSGFHREISDVDLSWSEASEEQIQAAEIGLRGDDGLLAVGYNYLVFRAGPAGAGIVLFATQFYTRVRRAVDPTACTSHDQCGLMIYTRPVTSRDDCYCPRCPVPGNVPAYAGYGEAWQTFCSDMVCPHYSCPPPPPVVCRADSTCGYDFAL